MASATRKTSEREQAALLTPLFAAIMPIALWPVEYLLPYPHIIEELAKVLLVWNLKDRSADTYFLAIASGIMFALSESVLYLMNIAAVGNVSTLFARLIMTSVLHVGTLLIILRFYHLRRGLIVVGVLIAMIVHYLFNNAVYLMFT